MAYEMTGQALAHNKSKFVPNTAAKKGTEVAHKQPPLGTGQRFAALKQKLSGKKGVTDPAGLSAYIGREKYGSGAMARMAAQGRKRG